MVTLLDFSEKTGFISRVMNYIKNALSSKPKKTSNPIWLFNEDDAPDRLLESIAGIPGAPKLEMVPAEFEKKTEKHLNKNIDKYIREYNNKQIEEMGEEVFRIQAEEDQEKDVM